MADCVQLPYASPWFAFTQGTAAPCIAMRNHPTAYNAILNQCTTLSCDRRFLNGYTTPQVGIPRLGVYSFGCLERGGVTFRFGFSHCREIIKQMLDEGFYIYFNGVDDYYLPGKSWYGIRHMGHDGILCGYDDNDGSYSIAAYDSNWSFRLIRLPQESFFAGVQACRENGRYGSLTAYRIKPDEVKLDEAQMLRYLRAHVDADMDHFPLTEQGNVEGIAVQGFLALYIGKLMDGSIPADKMDWRILRPVWEHKVCMLNRLEALETLHGWAPDLSLRYRPLVDAANRNRMLYAVYHRNHRPELLGKIRQVLTDGKEQEGELLRELIRKTEEERR